MPSVCCMEAGILWCPGHVRRDATLTTVFCQVRRSSSLCMGTQDAPPAKLQLPDAKLNAAAANAKQWGIAR